MCVPHGVRTTLEACPVTCGAASLAREDPVTDLIFVATTVAFFALMLGYVRACAALGRETDAEVPS